MGAVQHIPNSAIEQTARFYEPELDVLRFCAFLAVYCFHALPSGYDALIPRFGHAIPALLLAARNAMEFGVCMFFLLSSYLITKLLIIERKSTGSIHMKSFYIRRILRIWPLYLTFLLSMWFLGRLHVFYPIETGRLLAFLFFSGNIYTGLFGFTYNPILPLWTISIEEQFYIIWPALARLGTTGLKLAAWGLIALSVLASALLSQHSINVSQAVWTNSLVHFQFFAIGALLAIRFANRVPAYSTLQRAALAMSGLALLLIASGPLHIAREDASVAAPWLTVGYELMALGTVFLFLAFLGADRGRNKIPRTLTYLGKISYGLYVFHELSLQICTRISNH